MMKNQDFVLLFEEKVVYLQTKKLGRAQSVDEWCAHTSA